ncbi:MAG: hypothetical protein R3F46_08335 [bacterium]
MQLPQLRQQALGHVQIRLFHQLLDSGLDLVIRQTSHGQALHPGLLDLPGAPAQPGCYAEE